MANTRTPAERMRELRALKRRSGIVGVLVDVPDTPEAKASIRRSAAWLCEEARRVNNKEET